MPGTRIRLGTRASALARWQAQWVEAQLVARGVEVELVPITTRGDVQTAGTIASLGSPGVFTKELERSLLAGDIDLAVHSLKDLPTDTVEGLVLAAVPQRETVFDVLISRTGQSLADLPRGATIGTGSLRRRSQLLHARPDVELRDVRGNVDTRLNKVAEGQFDALVLAQAGLKRLGLEDRITEVLPSEIMVPAVGQGALGLETRERDEATRAAVAALDHAPSHQAVIAERTMLASLAGGCLAPVGAWARSQEDGQLRLDAVVLSADGRQRIAAHGVADHDHAAELGAGVARQLLSQGAAALIDESRGSA